MYPQFIDNERKTLVDTLRDIAKDYDVLRIATGYWDLAGTLKIINEIKDGSIKQNAFIHDRKIGKPNTLYLNLFKQSSYCTVNGYLIIRWILNGSFLSYQTTPGILSRRFFNVMVFSGRKVALLWLQL